MAEVEDCFVGKCLNSWNSYCHCMKQQAGQFGPTEGTDRLRVVVPDRRGKQVQDSAFEDKRPDRPLEQDAFLKSPAKP